MTVTHLAVPYQAEHIVLVSLAIAIVACICLSLWLIKQIMQVETKTRSINQEIQNRRNP